LSPVTNPSVVSRSLVSNTRLRRLQFRGGLPAPSQTSGAGSGALPRTVEWCFTPLS
jgi:hypothetical protein